MELLVRPQVAAQTQTLPTLPPAMLQLRRERPHPTSRKTRGEAGSGLRVGLAVDAGQVALHHA